MPWSEKQIVNLLRRFAQRDTKDGRATRVGIGDDAAVIAVPRGMELLVTTDLFVENVHFRRDLITAGSAGRRAIGRAISDIAAMGGTPAWAFLSLGLPGRTDGRWVAGFLRGLKSEAERYGVHLAGGDTGSSGSDVMLADLIVCGTAPAGKTVLRSGARPGDLLFVSGRLGATAAALAAGKRLSPVHPRIALGIYLRERSLASAMIDISDGLSTDLDHICEESGVGAEIRAEQIPLAGTLAQALNGGEDYELLFSVPAGRAAQVPQALGGVPLTCIGRVIKGACAYLIEDGRKRRLKPAGWEHRGKR